MFMFHRCSVSFQISSMKVTQAVAQVEYCFPKSICYSIRNWGWECRRTALICSLTQVDRHTSLLLGKCIQSVLTTARVLSLLFPLGVRTYGSFAYHTIIVREIAFDDKGEQGILAIDDFIKSIVKYSSWG